MNTTKKIWESATKIVFLSITAALIYFTAIKVIDGKDFLGLASMVFAFYFGQKRLEQQSQGLSV